MGDETTSAVSKTGTEAVIAKSMPVETLLAQAIEKKLPVETIERFLVMRRELKAEWAKEQFDAAMSKLQGELPIISKDKKVDFTSKRTNTRTTYAYAPIDSIIRQTRDVIARNGFSYTVTTEQSADEMTAICTVKHEAGHSEQTTFRVPLDKDAYMTGPQKVGAAMTFSKRYAFCNAFGIITGDEDNDATHIDDKPTKKSEETGGAEKDESIRYEPVNDAPFPDDAPAGTGKAPSDGERCPVCGTGTFKLRNGARGAFYGCSNYPNCKSTKDIA